MRNSLRLCLVAVSCLLLAACGESPPQGTGPAAASGPGAKGAPEAADRISADVIRDLVARLSSDAFEGRGPASRGDVRARKYLATQLEAAGFQPGAADGGWEQSLELVGITSDVPEKWRFERGDESLELERWDRFIAASGAQSEQSIIADAEVVFVGYGIEAPEYDWNDFKGQDLHGKVLLMLNNDPDWDPDLFQGTTRLYYGRWDYKYESAARHGAVGAIIIHTRASAGYPFKVVQTSWTGEQFELPTEGEPRLQVAAWVTEDAARDLAALAGRDLDALVESARSRDFQPVPLAIHTSVRFPNRLSRVRTANVLGLLPGRDPELRDQVVVYSAHHDHLGIGEPNASGDTIYNGARDNGAGVAQVIAIAQAFAALPEAPRRSILVALVAAEEQGLLGSEYYARHPTFPAGKIAADINFDGGNIWGRTRDVSSIGLGKSSLDDIVKAIAADQGRTVKPDLFPDRGHFYRSDQFNFAKIGVPSLYLHNGTDFIGRPEGWGREQVERYENDDYHQPSDELRDDWNFEGMIEDAKLGFWTGVRVANADEMPRWVAGDEFEAARMKALAEVR